MPKRSREIDIPVFQCFRIREDMTLRVRYAAMNVDGSIMLFHAGRCLECVLYMETTDMEYTEKDWLRRYYVMYSNCIEEKTEAHVIKENEEAKLFSEHMGIYSLSSGNLATSRNKVTGMQPKLDLVAFDEDQMTIKLKMESDVPSSKWTIGHTMHVSMKLKFAEVVMPLN